MSGMRTTTNNLPEMILNRNGSIHMQFGLLLNVINHISIDNQEIDNLIINRIVDKFSKPIS